MNKKVKVLVFPCGAENATEIYQALRYSIHVEIFGASSMDDHGRYTFEKYVGGLPNINEPGFQVEFEMLIDRLKIDMVFATHDSVMEYLSEKSQAIGFFLVNGAPKTTAVARKKSATYQMFAAHSWSPNVFPNPDAVDVWPAVIKPDCGQGGQDVQVVHDRAEASVALSRVASPVLMEYLPGDEVTVDCFTDRKGRLVWVGARTRERVRAGISMRSSLLPLDESIEGIAQDINASLKFRGPWFFQLKQDRGGRWKLLEFSCRVAGTMVAQRARGVNLPLMAVHDYLERDVKALANRCVEMVDRRIVTKAEMEHPYEAVFVDLDETLVIDGFAVPTVLAFIYQSIAAGKKLVLITRHAKNVAETLTRARIALNLFDEIIHITDGSSKALYVVPEAIFIDNHFPERYEVMEKCNVPVFDVDAIEFFLR
ncbi:ATP-grasp domain-containing protein [Delftia acidovorans]|uniref:ATP-grasp domain-containing protein n=1 Tax=Delftia acidovorans TaxID=80866 RepID=UPI0028EC6EA5|nr:ATP-grasp domain-containing protein [Delftia acidovorans]